jgi:hypothetical protein
MTCQECELLLADGEAGGSAEDHLRLCADCRALQEELAANALALESLRDDELPGTKMPLWPSMSRPAAARFAGAWMSAAAAAALFALIAHQVSQWKPIVETIPRPRVVTETVTVQPEETPRPASKLPMRRKPVAAPRGAPPEQPLLVKMLTPDPDVVVYWLVD